jgi:hypothetical protein
MLAADAIHFFCSLPHRQRSRNERLRSVPKEKVSSCNDSSHFFLTTKTGHSA